MATFESRVVVWSVAPVWGDPLPRVTEGTKPAILSVAVVGEKKLRVSFDQPMLSDSALIDDTNYTITPLDGDSVAVVVSEAVAGVGDFPTYVDLTIDKVLTIGTANYKVGAVNVKSAGEMTVSGDTVTFDGDCDRAYIAATVFPGNLVKVRVTYSRPVKMVSGLNPDDALNTNNYTISGGVTVDDLDAVSSTVVDLVVIGMETAHTYVVTVENVEDTSNNEVA